MHSNVFIEVPNLQEPIQIFVPKRTPAPINYTEVSINRSSTVIIAFGITAANRATISVTALPSDADTQLTCCLRFEGNSFKTAVNITRADCIMNVTLPLEESIYQLPVGDEERALRQRYTWMIDGTHFQENGIYSNTFYSLCMCGCLRPQPSDCLTVLQNLINKRLFGHC